MGRARSMAGRTVITSRSGPESGGSPRQYFDTALSANKYIFSSLLELVDHSHILFGSDYPFAPEDTTVATIKGLADLSLSSSQLFGIEQGNALSLLSPGLVPATVEG